MDIQMIIDYAWSNHDFPIFLCWMLNYIELTLRNVFFKSLPILQDQKQSQTSEPEVVTECLEQNDEKKRIHRATNGKSRGIPCSKGLKHHSKQGLDMMVAIFNLFLSDVFKGKK